MKKFLLRVVMYSFLTIILPSNFVPSVTYGQDNIQFLEKVPKVFVARYNIQHKHEYNPLHVGDMWQYYFEDNNPHYYATRVVADTIIQNKTYYKMVNWLNEASKDGNYFYWERNDSIKYATYMIDLYDVNHDGNTQQELLIDSLEVDNYSSTYLTNIVLNPGDIQRLQH